jgi:tetratricopeptide (TPR) repeat protein
MNGDLRAIRERCSAFFLTFAEAESQLLTGPDQIACLRRIDAELDNLRAILGWSRDGEVAAEVGLELAGALFLYWQLRGFTNEGWDWVTAMLALPGASAHVIAMARAQYSAAFLASMRSDFVAQRALAQESAAVLEEAGQLREAGRSRSVQGIAETRLGNLAAARTLLEQSVTIAQACDDLWGLALAFSQLGSVAYQEHDLTAARRFREESATAARANNDRHTLGVALAGLAFVARMQGHHEESSALFHESLLISSELDDQWTIPRAVGGLAGAAVLADDYERAARLFGAMAAMRELSGIAEAAGSFRELCAHDEADTRVALGSDAFATAWAEGRAMNPARAIAYALEARGARNPV